jgi:hypothetical protein
MLHNEWNAVKAKILDLARANVKVLEQPIDQHLFLLQDVFENKSHGNLLLLVVI